MALCLDQLHYLKNLGGGAPSASPFCPFASDSVIISCPSFRSPDVTSVKVPSLMPMNMGTRLRMLFSSIQMA